MADFDLWHLICDLDLSLWDQNFVCDKLSHFVYILWHLIKFLSCCRYTICKGKTLWPVILTLTLGRGNQNFVLNRFTLEWNLNKFSSVNFELLSIENILPLLYLSVMFDLTPFIVFRYCGHTICKQQIRDLQLLPLPCSWEHKFCARHIFNFLRSLI